MKTAIDAISPERIENFSRISKRLSAEKEQKNLLR